MSIRKALPVILTSAAMFIVLSLSWLPTTATPSAPHEGASPALPTAPGSAIRYVAPRGSDGGDCTTALSACLTVQYAVDRAAAGDEIHVATGVYTDIHARNGVTQVVYISKTVIIRGGYSIDFSVWDPAQYTTTLDAQGAGRVLYITGDITPTMEGFSLINGDATGLRGDLPWSYNIGGGVYVATATVTISNCRIVSNITSDSGGGMYFGWSNATLMNNTIMSNTASDGGGLALWSSAAVLMGNQIGGNTANLGGGLSLYYSGNVTLANNTIVSNTASGSGGGLALLSSAAVLTGNTIVSNTASGGGGGIEVYYSSNTTLADNTIVGNTAYEGGGLRLSSSDATLTGNIISSNTASDSGGGLYLKGSDAALTGNTIVGNIASNPYGYSSHGGGLYLKGSDAELRNDIVADNVASDGSGLYLEGSSPVLRHLTLARNDGSSGICITNLPSASSHAVLTDTILVGHTVGISVTTGNTATLQATLWGNGTDWDGKGTITTGTVNLQGDPAFVDPDAGDYHILPTSAAVDAGVNAGVTTDIDGEPRPVALGYDIGADEALNGPALQPVEATADQFYNPGEMITYTILVPNNGIITALGVRITDTLPTGQRPLSIAVSPPMTCTQAHSWGSTVVCGPTDIPAGTAALITLTARITTAFSGDAVLPMENHLAARGSNVATATTLLQPFLHDCHVRIDGSTAEYHSVQQAVDAASSGDLIKVAGICADAHTRNGVSQIAYIGKTVTLRGGYSTDFGTWNPAQYTTTLDARNAGRVLYITGNITPTVEGLSIVNGNATGLGGGQWRNDAGGGMYVVTATTTISACRISSNTSPYGGGLYLRDSVATLTNNAIVSNTAYGGGSGVYLDSSAATLMGNIISGNGASGSGGGLYLDSSAAMLTGNHVSNNTAYKGGGVCLYYSDATLTNNTIASNDAFIGGGLYLDYSDNAMLTGNTIISNTASDDGGGLYLERSNATLTGNTIVSNTASNDGGGLYLKGSDADLRNDIVADNVASDGSGLYLEGSSPVLRHLTLACNNGGSAIYVTEYNNRGGGIHYDAHIVATDTILVSHTVGIHVTTGSTATLQATLWGNGTDWGGKGTITTGTVNLRGDPAFVDPDAGDYHILPTSAAVDAGVNAGVTTDIDGEPRPMAFGYDIGADEFTLCPHPFSGASISGTTASYTNTVFTFAVLISPADTSTPISSPEHRNRKAGKETRTSPTLGPRRKRRLSP